MLFAASPGTFRVVQEEKPYDDFAREPLLPNKMSQFGPGQAWADVDGNGHEDSSSAGPATAARRSDAEPGEICSSPRPTPLPRRSAQRRHGSRVFRCGWRWRRRPLHRQRRSREQAGCPQPARTASTSTTAKDNFTRAPERHHARNETDSGGPVVAADFDRDGDLDLYVGGRCVPGAYPTAAKSHLLRNDAGKFTDITPPALATTGMVTAALCHRCRWRWLDRPPAGA